VCQHIDLDSTRDTPGNSDRYIGQYAQKINLTPLSACLKVMTEVEQVLALILKGGENTTQAVAN
jgi:hypothetical protein